MKGFWADFKKFITKGNIIDLAVAVVIGGAFNKIVTGLVNHIIMPLVGLAMGGLNVKDWKWVLKEAVLDETGAVVNVMFDAVASETKGLGTKVEDPAYIANFIGMTGADQPATVDVIANCTYSSKGAMEVVAKAITVYNDVK